MHIKHIYNTGGYIYSNSARLIICCIIHACMYILVNTDIYIAIIHNIDIYICI